MKDRNKDIPLIKLFTNNNNYFLYDTNKNQILRISKKIYIEVTNLLKIGTKCYLDKKTNTKEYNDVCLLIKKGYFNTPLLKGYKNRDHQYIPLLMKRCVSHLQLQVSKNCNFNCRYCSFAGSNNIGRNHENINMQFKVAKQSIDFLYNSSKDMPEVFIYFYGGEPLLNFDLIKKTVKYAQSRFISKRIIFSVVTNGSILNDDMIDFFSEHDFIFIISFDGDQETQDAHRRFLSNGTGTYKKVINNINKIRKKNPNFYKRNVRFNTVSFLDESKERVYDYFINELDKNSDFINLITPDTRGIDYYYDRLSYSNEYKKYEQSENYMSKYEGFLKSYNNKQEINAEWYESGSCIAGAQRLFVSVDGTFYPCEKAPEIPAVSIGNLLKGFDIDKVKQITDVANITKEKCTSCWAIRFCSMCVCHCIDETERRITKEAKLYNCQQNLLYAEKFLRNYVDNFLVNNSKQGGI